MYCKNCGEEIKGTANFCTKCGEKIVSEPISNEAAQPKSETINQTVFSKNENATENLSFFKKLFCKLSKSDIVLLVTISVFALVCITTFMIAKPLAGLVSMIQTALFVVAYLIKRKVIKLPLRWLQIVSIILACVLIVPYSALLNVRGDNESYVWSDIILSDILPEPESHFGAIYSNTNENLSMDVFDTTKDQYTEYADACIEKGFTIDMEYSDDSFFAYVDSGYQVTLDYSINTNTMRMDVESTAKLGNLKWPDSEIVKLIPQPKSTVGEIEANDDSSFAAYVGETTIDDFNEYVNLCLDKGFTVDKYRDDKSYSAKNSDGFKLTVNYQGNNVIYITLYEPEYTIDIEVECAENWIFNTYDVNVYIDDSLEGTLEHGETETYTALLKKGTYTVKFESEDDDTVTGEVKICVTKDEAFKFKISCLSTEIEVEVISGTVETEATETTNTEAETTESIETEPSTTEEYTEETQTEEPVTEEETEYETEETVITEPETVVNNSRTVYTTPYGKKYHYSASCAGKNATPTTEDDAKILYDPCKKCVE